MKKHRRIKRGTYRAWRENERIFKTLCEPHNNDRRRTFKKALFKRYKGEDFLKALK